MSKVRLLQITDSHLMTDKQATFRTQTVYQNLQAVIASAAQQQADALLLTGDLAQQLSEQSYQHYIELLQAWTMPIYWIPGNHDDPELMTKLFAGHFCAEKSFSVVSWQVILLNSKLPYDSGEGEVDQQQLDFLVEQIDAHPDKNIMLVLHHHVLPVNGYMDKYSLQNATQFLHMLEQYSTIKLVVSGHVHQAFDQIHNNIHFMTTPSTSYQIKPQTKKFQPDNVAPGYRVIDLYDDGTVHTQVIRCD